MEKIGYVFSSLDDTYIKEQIEAIKHFGVKKIILDEEEFNGLRRGDELIVYELKSLGKSITQLATFFNLVDELAEMESFIISERTTKGIQNARRSGRVGGRPKISEEKIEEIRYLYHNQSYTLRKIAEECNVSLGTAYKYIQE